MSYVHVSSLKDGKAQVTYLQYDTVDLNDRMDYPDGTKHYFEYDQARQRTASNDPLGRTTFGYDNLRRMTFRGNPGSENLYYEYDAASNRTSLKDPSGVKLTYDFDQANRLKEVASTQYSGFVAYYEYNLADQMVHEKRKNTTVTYHAYDAAARVSLIHHRKSAGTLIESWTYTRDEGGNPIQIDRGSDSMHIYFTYDQANRVTKEAWRANSGGSRDKYGFTYEYDPAGNRNRKTKLVGGTAHTYWNYDLADQMTIQKGGASTTVEFTFDSNGNLSVENDLNASAGRTYYDYDPRNLLTRVDFPGATATNYFYYNAQGERVRKDDSTAQKKYTWDGLMPVLEKNLSGSVLQRMVKGYTPISGIGEYTVQDLAGTLIYPHKNQVGTTMRHTDAAQNVDNTYEYDAWGQPFVTTQAADTGQQYRFTGKELDPDFVDFNSVSRRYNFSSRLLYPFRAVFDRQDPLGLVSLGRTRNSYAYVSANPVMKVDPAGLEDCTYWITSYGVDGIIPVWGVLGVAVGFELVAMSNATGARRSGCMGYTIKLGAGVGYSKGHGGQVGYKIADCCATKLEGTWDGAIEVSINNGIGSEFVTSGTGPDDMSYGGSGGRSLPPSPKKKVFKFDPSASVKGAATKWHSCWDDCGGTDPSVPQDPPDTTPPGGMCCYLYRCVKPLGDIHERELWCRYKELAITQLYYTAWFELHQWACGRSQFRLYSEGNRLCHRQGLFSNEPCPTGRIGQRFSEHEVIYYESRPYDKPRR